VYKLVACQNVNEALDETESRAWQKLLRVLTHEIMNSVAPISSLAETLHGRLQESVPLFDSKPGLLEDLDIGVDTIRRRSEGLMKFAETYRQLNNITSLQLKTINIKDVFQSLLRLMQTNIQQKQLHVEINIQDNDLFIEADMHLLEQVLINLFINAVDALRDVAHPKIKLSAYRDAALRPAITVSDNGQGISPELLDKIFIPFFSSKKNGSGIGLSLCKQIMLLHKGNIQVESTEGKGTTFMLLF
jgi:signal transduction histidine kinase